MNKNNKKVIKKKISPSEKSSEKSSESSEDSLSDYSDDYNKSEKSDKSNKKIKNKNKNEDDNITTELIDNDNDNDDEDDNMSINEEYDNNDKKIVKSERVLDKDRITRPKITKYEKAKIMSVRTQQIISGSKIQLNYEGDINKLLPYQIAELEYNNNSIPLKIKRTLPNGKYEIWKISELI